MVVSYLLKKANTILRNTLTYESKTSCNDCNRPISRLPFFKHSHKINLATMTIARNEVFLKDKVNLPTVEVVVHPQGLLVAPGYDLKASERICRCYYLPLRLVAI
ncbi:hypothetical protein BKP57_12965 [Virgibacillus sp. 6R]|uniref:Uncharacterized protein n=2 Tax=Virgibacillus pantothenticus TaxID=1473 RepID=A0A0L0QUZ7_VIRPA|nr:hypothetical protein BKP57_12965 [Virgibacillus sp. 6R]KNE22409.1 hypothetical protein AFK71_01965 [Virgibacillus pantothenticus]SIS86090.1 hypothetical protein SAMN05421787_10556 [Virgibacillus pantothenticus]